MCRVWSHRAAELQSFFCDRGCLCVLARLSAIDIGFRAWENQFENDPSGGGGIGLVSCVMRGFVEGLEVVRGSMRRRDRWQGILDVETKRWSSMSCDQFIVELNDVRAYVVEVESERYQVEVQLLENTNSYVLVLVAVDDGSLPASIVPLTGSFVRQKGDVGVERS